MSTTKLAEALRLGIEALTCAGSHAECQSLEVYAKEQMREALASYEAEPAVQVVVERERVWVKRGVQSFALAYEAETDAEREWYAGQLRAALSGFTPDVKTEAEAKPAVPVADGCQVVHVVMKEDGTIHLKKGDRSTWVGYKSDDKADQEWRAGCISRLLGHSGWDAAAPAAPAPAWQPIETAPKDGTTVLTLRIFNGEPQICDARYFAFHDAWGQRSWRYPAEAGPTHWMPLPAPPAIATGKGGAK